MHPLVRRRLRNVRVSWRPWLSEAHVTRLVTAASATDRRTGDVRVSRVALYTPHQAGGVAGVESPPTRRSDTVSAEAWAVLFEHVPSFFVAVALVEASLQRVHSPEQVARMLAVWTKGHHHHGSTDGAPLQWGHPFVEVSPCGSAVRAPTRDACLQAGCPAHLLYATQHVATRSATAARYSLLRCSDGSPGAMNEALALLCAVAPSAAPRSLTEVRERFRCHAASPEMGASTSVRLRLPCAEALLDHPDLAFAVEVTDRVSGQHCIGLPHTAKSEGICGPFVQLGRSLSHPHRGRADAAFAATAAAAAAVASPLTCIPAARDGGSAHAFSVRFHDARASAAVVLRDVAALLSASQSAADAEDAAPVFCLRGVGSLILVGAVQHARRVVDVVAVESRELCTLLRAERGTSGDTAPVTESRNGQPLVESVSRLIGSAAVAKIVPTQAFTGCASGRGASAHPAESIMEALLRTLPASALETVCCLEHVAHFVGYPTGAAPPRVPRRVDADVLLAATILARCGCTAEPPKQSTSGSAGRGLAEPDMDTANRPESDGAAEEGDVNRCLTETAAVTLAASLLLTHLGPRAHPPPPQHRDGHAAAADSAEWPLHASLLTSLRRWARGPSWLAQQDGLRRRLTRYQGWLAGATGVHDCARDIASVPVCDTANVTEGLEVKLGDLVRMFGPEPLPLAHSSPQRRTTACTSDAASAVETQESPSCRPHQTTALDTAKAQLGRPLAPLPMTATPAPPPLEVPQEPSAVATELDDVDVDALLYDSLNADAAAVLQESAVAKETGAASEGVRALPHVDSAVTTPPPSSTPLLTQSAGEGAASTTASACGAAEDDALRSYLSSLFDDTGARPQADGVVAPPVLMDGAESQKHGSVTGATDSAKPAAAPAVSAPPAFTTATDASLATVSPTLPSVGAAQDDARNLPRAFLLGPAGRTGKTTPVDVPYANGACTTTPSLTIEPPAAVRGASGIFAWPPSPRAAGEAQPSAAAAHASAPWPSSPPALRTCAQSAASCGPGSATGGPPVEMGDGEGDALMLRGRHPGDRRRTHHGQVQRAHSLHTARGGVPRPPPPAWPGCTPSPPPPPVTPCAALGSTDAERLRLASLLVDILRSTSRPPSPPPH